MVDIQLRQGTCIEFIMELSGYANMYAFHSSQCGCALLLYESSIGIKIAYPNAEEEYNHNPSWLVV